MSDKIKWRLQNSNKQNSDGEKHGTLNAVQKHSAYDWKKLSATTQNAGKNLTIPDQMAILIKMNYEMFESLEKFKIIVQNLQVNVAKLQTDVAKLQTDVTNLQSDNTHQQNVENLNSLLTLKEEIDNLSMEAQNMAQQQSSIRQDDSNEESSEED